MPTVYLLNNNDSKIEELAEFYKKNGCEVKSYNDLAIKPPKTTPAALLWAEINVIAQSNFVAFDEDWASDMEKLAIYFFCKATEIKMLKEGTFDNLHANFEFSNRFDEKE